MKALNLIWHGCVYDDMACCHAGSLPRATPHCYLAGKRNTGIFRVVTNCIAHVNISTQSLVLAIIIAWVRL